MSDLIDREQAKDAIDKYLVGRNLVTDGTMMARIINEIVIDRLPSAQPTFDARDTQYNLPIGTDLISRAQAIDALDEYFGRIAKLKRRGLNKGEKAISLDVVGAIKTLPPIQPDKDKVSDLLYHIYSIQSPHLDMSGVIAKKYYCEELWKALFGKESELPGWMI